MIHRDIQFAALDGTTNTPKIVNQDYTFILPPLWPWQLVVVERVCVVLEPQEGSLDSPTPNAFVSAIPPAWTAGNDFTISLIQQDWEVEGFANNDEVFILMTQNLFTTPPRYIGVRARIRSVNANVASFRIINAIVSGANNLQNPVALTCFLLDEANEVEGALHTGNNSGDTSPLSGLPFMQPHADGLIGSAFTSNILPPLTYNTRLYSAGETLMDNLFPALQARRFREYIYFLAGTQFYAYRTNLDPTAQTPTNLYQLNGTIDISIKKRSAIRSFDYTFRCLLLHPNRVENTNNYLPPGTLTISGNTGTLTPPAGFTPQQSLIFLLGSDAHHSSEDIINSIILTEPTSPPTLPPQRQDAYYVGVMVGQTPAGSWVAVMTNKELTIQPQLGILTVYPPLGTLYRYDSVVARLQDYVEFPGTYIIQTLIKIYNQFVPIEEAIYTTDNQVTNAFFSNPRFASLSNIYPYILTERNGTAGLGVGFNWDFIIHVDPTDSPLDAPPKFLSFMIPVPSFRRPPTVPIVVTTPSGGYALDLINWLGNEITLKWRLFLPSGTVVESNPITFGPASSTYTNRFAPDHQDAFIVETASFIVAGILVPILPTPTFGPYYTTIRAAIFNRPENTFTPVKQSIRVIGEAYFPPPNTPGVLFSYSEIASGLGIFRPFFFFSRYVVIVDKTQLPPGRYVLHVRHAITTLVNINWQVTQVYDESYLYDFNVSGIPINQPQTPLAKKACEPSTPAIYKEDWDFIYLNNSGEWKYVSTNIYNCKLDNYCTCFTLVNTIPKDYIDIIAYFKGSVFGIEIPSKAKHKARFIGRITRIDDEYETEDFVTSTYKKESIVRAYSEKYEVELIIQNPCDMSHVDIIKFAERCDIVNRNNFVLPDRIYDLKPENISITNEPLFAKVKISFSKIRWRDEYRRQG